MPDGCVVKRDLLNPEPEPQPRLVAPETPAADPKEKSETLTKIIEMLGYEVCQLTNKLTLEFYQTHHHAPDLRGKEIKVIACHDGLIVTTFIWIIDRYGECKITEEDATRLEQLLKAMAYFQVSITDLRPVEVPVYKEVLKVIGYTIRHEVNCNLWEIIRTDVRMPAPDGKSIEITAYSGGRKTFECNLVADPICRLDSTKVPEKEIREAIAKNALFVVQVL